MTERTPYQRGTSVYFPTNSDTVADDVDGKTGTVIGWTREGKLRVTVELHTIDVWPDDVVLD